MKSRRTDAKLAPVFKNRWIRLRIYMAACLLSLFFAAMAYKAYGIQIANVDHYRQLARRQHLSSLEIPAARGFIYDRKGRELAVTADVDSVFASPREISDVNGTAEVLAELLDVDVRVLESRLTSQRYFVWVKRRVTPSEARAVKELDLPGVELMAEPRRFYPSKSLGATVLGFAGIDGNGLEGIELAMNELLVGRNAKLAALRDARGNIMLANGMSDSRPGASITVTIDRSIQFIAERALESAISTHRAKAGCALVLDVATAEVLAMANWPTFDPNKPAGRDRQARNRSVTDAYEIGSAMKIFTVAAALEAGIVTPATVIDVENGRFRVARKLIRDSYHDRELDIGGIIKRSSNVGAAKIAAMLGPEALHDALAHYGFGRATGIELPGERAGLLRDPKRWGRIGLATISYGYGLTTTALQLAAATAAIGNGGVMHEPRIIKQVVDDAGRELYRNQPAGRRIVTEKTAAEILPMMASVFDKGKKGGTARKIDVVGFHAAGKTSTAHKVDPRTHKYGADLYLSSFVGLAPLDNPRIAVLILIDEPRGEEYYGAQVAGPAFAQITSETLRYLGVPTTKAIEVAAAAAAAPEADAPEAEEVVLADFPVIDENAIEDPIAIPDFTGLGVARALDVAADLGLDVDIEGSGVAISQSPAAGLVSRPARCRIVFGPVTPHSSP